MCLPTRHGLFQQLGLATFGQHGLRVVIVRGFVFVLLYKITHTYRYVHPDYTEQHINRLDDREERRTNIYHYYIEKLGFNFNRFLLKVRLVIF